MVVSVNKSLQCSVVGDGFVGKSCLVERFLGGEFNSEYVATLQDDYIAKCNVNGDSLEMNITDFAGEVGSTSLKLLSFENKKFKLLNYL